MAAVPCRALPSRAVPCPALPTRTGARLGRVGAEAGGGAGVALAAGRWRRHWAVGSDGPGARGGT